MGSIIKNKYKDIEFNREGWIRELLHKIGRENRDSLILSKMNGEVTLFVQLSVLTIIFWIQNSYKLILGFDYSNFNPPWYIFIGIFIFFLYGAIDFAARRAERAHRIIKILDKKLK